MIAVMARLRAPEGCPWDQEQTHRSLAIHLLEEAHETMHAIDEGDMDALKEELGDVLLQVVFHSEIAEESGAFDANDVIETLITKLVARHPHVFSDTVVKDAKQVVANWEQIKGLGAKRSSIKEGIPHDLPALLLAHKALRRLSGTGADVSGDPSRVARLASEASTEEGWGELAMEVVRLASDAGIDPEGALRRAARSALTKYDEAQKSVS